jgi:hypothetical protein
VALYRFRCNLRQMSVGVVFFPVVCNVPFSKFAWKLAPSLLCPPSAAALWLLYVVCALGLCFVASYINKPRELLTQIAQISNTSSIICTNPGQVRPTSVRSALPFRRLLGLPRCSFLVRPHQCAVRVPWRTPGLTTCQPLHLVCFSGRAFLSETWRKKIWTQFAWNCGR